MIEDMELRTVIDSLDEGLFIADVVFDQNNDPLGLSFVMANPVAERIVGPDHAGNRMSEVERPLKERWLIDCSRVARTGESIHLEDYEPSFKKWLNVFIFKIGGRDSRRIGILFRDITTRKRAEEALKLSEERQAFLLKLSDALRPLSDPLEIQHNASRVLGEHLGAGRVAYGEVSDDGSYLVVEHDYSKEGGRPATGRYRMADFGPNIFNALTAGHTIVIRNVRDAREFTEAEREMLLELGVSSIIAVPLNKGGKLVAMLIVHSPRPQQWSGSEVELAEETGERTWAAVERARAEQARQESEKRLRVHIENSPVGVIEWDDRFIVTMWAGDAERIFGWTAQEIIGKNIMALNMIYPEDIPIVEDTIARLTAKGAGKVVTVNRNITKDGRILHCTWYNTVLPGRDGNMASVFSIVVDDTNRVRVEKELKRSNDELQNFAYVTSHDLREPLRMISSYLDLLEQRYKGKVLDEKGAEFIDYAVDGANRMRQMIDDLLVYSRIETRDRPLTEVDMNEVLNTTLKDLSSSIDKNEAQITSDRLPMVRANKTQMILVLDNIIGNAVKFHGQEPPRVHVKANKGLREWILSIKDNGIGIDPRDNDKLFNMFQRLHTQQDYPGTGIGLAITKKIVERHGGRIWFESEPGKGTTFYFTIPVAS